MNSQYFGHRGKRLWLWHEMSLARIPFSEVDGVVLEIYSRLDPLRYFLEVSCSSSTRVSFAKILIKRACLSTKPNNLQPFFSLLC